jgi:hypothetical protein
LRSEDDSWLRKISYQKTIANAIQAVKNFFSADNYAFAGAVAA